MLAAPSTSTGGIVYRALLVGGALAIVVGTGLQAMTEVATFDDLLNIWRDRGTRGIKAAERYLRVYRHLLPLLGLLALIVAALAVVSQAFRVTAGPAFAIVAALVAEIFRRAFDTVSQAALAADTEDAAARPSRARDEPTIRSQLGRTRNWAVVVLGASLILVGSAIDLAQALGA